MNPIDEYLEFRKEASMLSGITGLVKKPGFFSRAASALHGEQAMGEMGKQLLSAGGLAAGGLAFVGGLAAVNKIRNAVTRADDFRSMMQLNPDLAAERQQNPRFFVAAYNSLRRINPTFGTDPVVSGAYMRKMMMSPDTAGLTLAQSVKPPVTTGLKSKFGPFEMGTA